MIDIKKLERDLAIEKGASKLKIGARKLNIRGDMDGEDRIEIWSNPSGCDIRWCGHIEQSELNIKDETLWVYNYCTLSRADMARLGRWLIEKSRSPWRHKGGR